ncbi:hypothetical protein B296_00005398 [Ensete ventricosum]|uniref:Uncharacterized protein n=1 Tax=Ensete ventricosum TaxID=4639 RepID=A0A427B7V6_ENSVE|nr:hypothetical protein B296_00005398 [Ensete ventricosum]
MATSPSRKRKKKEVIAAATRSLHHGSAEGAGGVQVRQPPLQAHSMEEVPACYHLAHLRLRLEAMEAHAALSGVDATLVPPHLDACSNVWHALLFPITTTA